MKLKVNDVIKKQGSCDRFVQEVMSNTVLLDAPILSSEKYHYTEQELLDEGWKFSEAKWVPKKDDKYYFITLADIGNTTFYDESRLDKERLEIGNCCETKELAEEALRRVLLAYKG